MSGADDFGGEILFLAHRIPYPPNKGEKIRAWNMIRHLARLAPIHIGAPVDDPADLEHRAAVEAVAASACLPQVDPRVRKLRASLGLLTGEPLTLPYFRNRTLKHWADTVRANRKIVLEVVYSSGAITYCTPEPRPGTARLVDFVDLDSDKWRQYARTAGLAGRIVYGREAQTLAAEEVRIARSAHASTFVSEQEAALFRAAAPELADTIHAVGNGVDIDYFSPAHSFDSPFAAAPHIVFTGAMDYWANVDAVLWFANDILPRIRREVPQAVFVVVGSNPAPEVRALAGRPDVLVTGRVPDVRPYVAFADVCVAPMRIARGIQNKVLEGMAMGRAVVTTSMGFEGIDAAPGTELAVADGADAIADEVVRLLGDPAARGQFGDAARARAVESFGWDARLADLDRVIALARARAGHDLMQGFEREPEAAVEGQTT